jgi:intracellular multiplication protein IcmC
MADPVSGGMATQLTNHADMLANIANSLEPIQRLISGAAYVMGCAFLFKAIYTLKAYGEARTMSSTQANIKEPLLYLFVGAIFIYLPTGVSLVLQTTFGAGATIIGYTTSTSSQLQALFGVGSAVGKPLTMIIQVIGLIAFIRGWVLITRASSQGQQPGGMGKGFMHVFGGIVALNIIKTLEIINATLYG